MAGKLQYVGNPLKMQRAMVMGLIYAQPGNQRKEVDKIASHHRTIKRPTTGNVESKMPEERHTMHTSEHKSTDNTRTNVIKHGVSATDNYNRYAAASTQIADMEDAENFLFEEFDTSGGRRLTKSHDIDYCTADESAEESETSKGFKDMRALFSTLNTNMNTQMVGLQKSLIGSHKGTDQKDGQYLRVHKKEKP